MKSGIKGKKSDKVVFKLKDCTRELQSLVGGKAVGLGELINLGYNVPEGFVISYEAFQQNGLSNKVKEQIHKTFDDLNLKKVAVRSSAIAEDAGTASFAGQFETYLSISRDNLMDAIENCWKSSTSERVTSYADASLVGKEGLNVSVVVQRMVSADTSGVMFTANPINKNSEIIIEGIYGLGELMVGGIVTPQSITLDKSTGRIKSNRKHKQDIYLNQNSIKNKLPKKLYQSNPIEGSKLISEFFKLAINIEKDFGRAQDIEWAINNDDIYVLQSRPITTINNLPSSVPSYLSKCEKYITRPSVLQRDEIFRVTTNAMMPINIATIGRAGNNRTYYFDKKQGEKLFSICSKFVSSREKLEAHLNDYQDIITYCNSICVIIDNDPTNYRRIFDEYINFLKRLAPFMFTGVLIDNEIFPELKLYIEENHHEDKLRLLQILSAPVKYHDFQLYRKSICEIKLNHKNSIGISEIAQKYAHLNQYLFCEKIMTKDDVKSELSKLSVSDAKKELTAINYSLEQDENWQIELSNILGDTEHFLKAVLIKNYTWLRTDRIDLIRKIHLRLRDIYLSLAKEMTIKSGLEWELKHVINLTNEEINNFIDYHKYPNLKSVAKRIDQKYVYYFTKNKGKVITDKNVAKLLTEVIGQSDYDGKLLNIDKGMTAYEGVVRGKIVKIVDKSDLKKVLPGDIMVAFVTMPDYTPQMRIAGGFITSEGGITSHAAIVARELKKPCIIGSSNCMEILEEGEEVILDSINRVVKRLN